MAALSRDNPRLVNRDSQKMRRPPDGGAPGKKGVENA